MKDEIVKKENEDDCIWTLLIKASFTAHFEAVALPEPKFNGE